MIREREEEVFEEEELLSEEVIQLRVAELGRQIREVYHGKNVLMVAVLNGAMMFHSDLMREAALEDSETDSLGISSYDKKIVSSGNPRITKDLNNDITGRNVLVVEDIVHTGLTAKAILEILLARGAASVRICSLLSKDNDREVEVPVDYVGFSIPSKWVEGYGLDSKGKGRYRRNIVTITMLKDGSSPTT